MARKLAEGTVSRRVRLKVPGWRDGIFDKHLGKAEVRTAERWRLFLEECHRQGFYDVLDAVMDGVLKMSVAYNLSVQGGAGLLGVRQHLQDLAAKRAAAAAAGDFEAWMDEFLEIKPRKRASAKQYLRIEYATMEFMAFIVERHELPGPGGVTPDHWTRDNMRAWVTHYIDTKHGEKRVRLEAAWAEMDEPPPKVEREEILRKDRGAKRSTVNHLVNAVGSFSQWLLEHGRIAVDPAVGVRITSKAAGEHLADDHRHLEPDELAAVVEASRKTWDGNPARPGPLWWRWLAASGCTVYTEGVRIRPIDIKMGDEVDGTVPVKITGSKSKGGYRTREGYLPAEMAREILDQAKAVKAGRDGLVFPYTPAHGRLAWERIVAWIEEHDPAMAERLAGATPACLRHTYAVNALRGGVDIVELRDLMGHADISTTAQYLRHTSSARTRLRGVFEGVGLV